MTNFTLAFQPVYVPSVTSLALQQGRFSRNSFILLLNCINIALAHLCLHLLSTILSMYLKTHWLDGEEFSEVGLRVSEVGAISIGMMGETLCPLASFRTRQQDSNLGCPNMIWEIFVGCWRSCDNLWGNNKKIWFVDKYTYAYIHIKRAKCWKWEKVDNDVWRRQSA